MDEGIADSCLHPPSFTTWPFGFTVTFFVRLPRYDTDPDKPMRNVKHYPAKFLTWKGGKIAGIKRFSSRDSVGVWKIWPN